ncbi:MAG TPA: hypothetical protein VNJ29_01340, partial [Candidatus Nitrosotenuis sp.]|nr:hypothetical protein [Candidatus Nitrosotenuis sp.]
ATMTKINLKIAQKAMDPENRKIIKDAAENIKKGIEKFKELPKVIADTTLLIKDVGILIGEGTTCVDTLVTDIVEGVEGIVEGLGGVAACTTGVGCLEELLTVKSIAVGAASTVASDISCAATVANAAKNGARDVINLVKLLYSYTELIDAVVSLKDDVVATYDALKDLSDDIKQEVPELTQKLHVVGAVVADAETQVKKLIPRIRNFATQLVVQLKGNINQLMYCKSEVSYIFKLAGYTIKDGFTGSIKAAAHVLKADQIAAAIKKQFSSLHGKVEAELKKRIDHVKSELHEIKSNPITGLKKIPSILKDIEQIPVTVVKHAIGTAEASIKDSIKVLKHHQSEAKKELADKEERSEESGIESIKKPVPVKIEGENIDEAVEKAMTMAKKLGSKKGRDEGDEDE